MAEKLSAAAATAETPTAGHNAAVRREALQKGLSEALQLWRQRDAAQAQARGFSKQATAIFRRLKADYGWQRTELEYALRTSQMPQEQRDELIDTLREAFEALGVGGQGTFFAVGETVGFTVDARIDMSEKALRNSYRDGYETGRIGGTMDECPYPNGMKDQRRHREQWLSGHQAAQKKAAADTAPAGEAVPAIERLA